MPNDEKARELSVSEAVSLAKGALESIVLTLVGEVSEFSNKAGYKAVYFTVKDEGASLPCMMWANKFKAAGVNVSVGTLVQLTGRFTIYAPKGRMNFDVYSITLAGEGKLREQVAQLARKLHAEGLMDPARKRPVPAYPQTIGLVTSPRGAAVRDVLRTLRRRYPLARIVLAGVPVEGQSAAADLSLGIAEVAKAGAEVVLLVRGGGSFEDLMPFNDEHLARSVAACPVPVVTGIGHEPDTCICDMVADVRASTPTAAAELVSPDCQLLAQDLESASRNLSQTLSGRLERTQAALELFAHRGNFNNPQALFATDMQTLDMLEERLHRSIPHGIEKDRARIARTNAIMLSLGRGMLGGFSGKLALGAARLGDLSPLSILGRGYAIARNQEGHVVSSVDDVSAGDVLKISVSDGHIIAQVESSSLADYESISWKD